MFLCAIKTIFFINRFHCLLYNTLFRAYSQNHCHALQMTHYVSGTTKKMLLLTKQCMSNWINNVQVWPLFVNTFILFIAPALYEKRPLKGFLSPPAPGNVDNPSIFFAFLWRCCWLRGFRQKAGLLVRYKRKELNQVGYSLVQEQQQFQQQQQQQQLNDQQNDFHWNEHDEQGKVSLIVLLFIILPLAKHQHFSRLP